MIWPVLFVFTSLFLAFADGDSLHSLLAKSDLMAGQRVDVEGIVVVAPGRERLCATLDAALDYDRKAGGSKECISLAFPYIGRKESREREFFLTRWNGRKVRVAATLYVADSLVQLNRNVITIGSDPVALEKIESIELLETEALPPPYEWWALASPTSDTGSEIGRDVLRRVPCHEVRTYRRPFACLNEGLTQLFVLSGDAVRGIEMVLPSGLEPGDLQDFAVLSDEAAFFYFGDEVYFWRLRGPMELVSDSVSNFHASREGDPVVVLEMENPSSSGCNLVVVSDSLQKRAGCPEYLPCEDWDYLVEVSQRPFSCIDTSRLLWYELNDGTFNSLDASAVLGTNQDWWIDLTGFGRLGEADFLVATNSALWWTNGQGWKVIHEGEITALREVGGRFYYLVGGVAHAGPRGGYWADETGEVWSVSVDLKPMREPDLTWRELWPRFWPSP